MHFWNLLWDWNTLDSVRGVHNFLEGGALVFFALLVIFDTLAHLTEDKKPKRAKLLERIGLWCFGVAVLSEILAYPYSERNDTLSSRQDAAQRDKIAALDNSTQRLKTDAENARAQAEGFKAQISASDARVKTAEAQVATAMAASDDAVARVKTADARIAEAQRGAAEAQRVAESERLERVRLEAIVAPRSISITDQRAIAASLLRFAGRRVSVTTYSLDGDAAALGQQVIAILEGARIGVDNRIASMLPLGGFAFAIHVTGTRDDLVVAISEALLRIGHLGVVRPNSPTVGGTGMQAVPENTASVDADILIGVKPLPVIAR